ncbi:MAG: hypothetical protein JWP69_1428 [Flaviaesturariibacter sp.]|nr:hypothetical protein [Flaviaesturariibacter sp.]
MAESQKSPEQKSAKLPPVQIVVRMLQNLGLGVAVNGKSLH